MAEDLVARLLAAAEEVMEHPHPSQCDHLHDAAKEMRKAADEIERLRARTDPMEGHDKPCYYCQKPCNGLAGNPSEWPVALCHPDNPGRVKWHHVGCVSDRLHGRVQQENGSAEHG